MNEGIKSIIDLGLAVGQVGVDLAQQKSLGLVFVDLEKAGMDVPAVVSNAATVKAEVAALSGTESEKDLIAYVGGKVAGLTGDAHAQAIIQASIKLAEDLATDVPALVAAIAGPAPAAPAA